MANGPLYGKYAFDAAKFDWSTGYHQILWEVPFPLWDNQCEAPTLQEDSVIGEMNHCALRLKSEGGKEWRW